MAGTLYVVATPIGNLEDVTVRALRILREVSIVAAEDTRRSGQLLRHFGIATKLVSVHEHNESARVTMILGHLARGESVALVTDAGTPGISDPGATLVAAVAAAGHRVEPIPGPSAVIAALSASGASGPGFSFLGFPPVKANDRTRWFERLRRLVTDAPVVFFEAPHRIQRTLEELAVLVNDQIVVGRELTKLHETFYRGRPLEILAALTPVAGEFTVVIPRVIPEAPADVGLDHEAIKAMFGQITDKPARAAARQVAEATGLSVNAIYDIVQGKTTGKTVPEPISPDEIRRRQAIVDPGD